VFKATIPGLGTGAEFGNGAPNSITELVGKGATGRLLGVVPRGVGTLPFTGVLGFTGTPIDAGFTDAGFTDAGMPIDAGTFTVGETDVGITEGSIAGTFAPTIGIEFGAWMTEERGAAIGLGAGDCMVTAVGSITLETGGRNP
jgi:hypothetical protein